MDIIELKRIVDEHNACDTERSWTMSGLLLQYENEYLDIVRVDSSNKWVGIDNMSKMWSIIFRPKKDFSHLETFKKLTSVLNVAISPVSRGINKGCYGIRIYEMKKEPDRDVVKAILDFIFP